MTMNRVLEYPFFKEEIPFQDSWLQCMLCGYEDTKTVFHPLRKVTVKTTYHPVRSGVATNLIDIDFPLPGTRNIDILRCPQCLALDERSLGNKIWNLL